MSQEKELVIDTVQQLSENMELFYQQKNAKALGEFQQVLVKLTTMIDTLFAYRDTHTEFSLDEEKLKGTLVEAMNALEEGDYILLADIVQYDLIEYVQELIDRME